ncbi:MAG: FHA domain-containing protein [Coriobacteriales bacterium]|jgi:hypothetical protein|nr:FHA domain-containing protein [Coriobacteriales bacterium]
MKYSYKRDKKAKSERLEARTTKGEEMDYPLAEHLRVLQVEPLLPFSYESRGSHVTFFYDLATTAPLPIYLRGKLSAAQFEQLLWSFFALLRFCQDDGLDTANVLLPPTYIRIEPDSLSLRFAYLPIKSGLANNATPAQFLQAIAQSADFVSRADSESKDSLLDYLKRQTIFMTSDFGDYLLSKGILKAGEYSSKNTVGSGHDRGKLLEKDPASVQPRGYDFVREQAHKPSKQEIFESLSLAEQAYHTATKRSEKHEFDAGSPPVSSGKTTCVNVTAPQKQKSDHRLSLRRNSNGVVIPLAPDRSVTLGRSQGCDVQIDGNSGISRRHITLNAENGHYLVTDLGSSNGTFLERDGIKTRLEPNTAYAICQDDILTLHNEHFVVI